MLNKQCCSFISPQFPFRVDQQPSEPPAARMPPLIPCLLLSPLWTLSLNLRPSSDGMCNPPAGGPRATYHALPEQPTETAGFSLLCKVSSIYLKERRIPSKNTKLSPWIIQACLVLPNLHTLIPDVPNQSKLQDVAA